MLVPARRRGNILMTTITISSGTTTVSTTIPLTTHHVVEGSGTLDVANGGTVSGLITVDGAFASVNVSALGFVADTVISSGSENVYGGATDTTVYADGIQRVIGGIVITTTISGGEQDVYSGGSVAGI